jgi:hypothetical protein
MVCKWLHMPGSSRLQVLYNLLDVRVCGKFGGIILVTEFARHVSPGSDIMPPPCRALRRSRHAQWRFNGDTTINLDASIDVDTTLLSASFARFFCDSFARALARLA